MGLTRMLSVLVHEGAGVCVSNPPSAVKPYVLIHSLCKYVFLAIKIRL